MQATNISRSIKYVFLSFLQSYYKEHNKYKWDANPKNTSVIIADKYSIDMGVAAMRPSIILDRGSIGWTNTLRNEARSLNTGPYNYGDNAVRPELLGNERNSTYKLTDLLSSSVTFNVVSKSAFAADELANEVFCLLTAHRELFKNYGVHKMSSLTIGKENNVMVDGAEVKLVLVPVQLSFVRQETIILAENYFNAQVFMNGEPLAENVDYSFEINGTQIQTYLPYSDADEFTINYVDAITLAPIFDVSLIKTGSTKKLLNIPDNGKVYGYYKIFENFEVEDINII